MSYVKSVDVRSTSTSTDIIVAVGEFEQRQAAVTYRHLLRYRRNGYVGLMPRPRNKRVHRSDCVGPARDDNTKVCSSEGGYPI